MGLLFPDGNFCRLDCRYCFRLLHLRLLRTSLTNSSLQLWDWLRKVGHPLDWTHKHRVWILNLNLRYDGWYSLTKWHLYNYTAFSCYWTWLHDRAFVLRQSIDLAKDTNWHLRLDLGVDNTRCATSCIFRDSSIWHGFFLHFTDASHIFAASLHSYVFSADFRRLVHVQDWSWNTDRKFLRGW